MSTVYNGLRVQQALQTKLEATIHPLKLARKPMPVLDWNLWGLAVSGLDIDATDNE